MGHDARQSRKFLNWARPTVPESHIVKYFCKLVPTSQGKSGVRQNMLKLTLCFSIKGRHSNHLLLFIILRYELCFLCELLACCKKQCPLWSQMFERSLGRYLKMRFLTRRQLCKILLFNFLCVCGLKINIVMSSSNILHYSPWSNRNLPVFLL